MSYVSVLKNIPDFLSQPTGVAALASVGIHGAIAFILPLVPMVSKPKEATSSPRTVGLVELNQAEQNRLPQTSTAEAIQQPQLPPQSEVTLQSQVPLESQVPPFPSFASQPTILPPQPSAPIVEEPLPTISLSRDNLNIVSLPQNQYLRLPQGRSETSIPSIPRVNYGEVTNLQTKIPLGQPQSLPSVPSKPPLPGNLPELQAANIPTDLPNTPPVVPANTTTPTTPSPSAVPQTQEFVAPIAPTPQVGDQLALAGTTLPQWQQISVPKTAELPSTSEGTEQLLAKTTTFVEQFQKIKQQYPNVETKQPIKETVNAQQGQAGKIEGGLVIDSEGKVDTIDFLDNSVSSELKTATREYFRQYFQSNPVQANGKPKYYPFSLSFNPNSDTTQAAASPKPPVVIPRKLAPLQLRDTQPLDNEQQGLRSPQEKLVPGQVQQIPSKLPPQWQPVTVNQPSSPAPQTTAKPSPQWQPVTVNQSSATPQVTAQPVSQPQGIQNQSNSTQESDKNLINKLRQVKNDRQSSN
ncbi:MAG: hypothetical protein IGS49_23955 [Chlorogloeopsis fritschii C42_A2020_084]|uniref:hypothetical protein n=1 Tax=Chlorogloeopsis fritschii TaxID=1124 RepID=UPI0019EFF53E|nr:hypothetical protein [Chlorogloeopsis fritschii]MBF2008413.1 hypothetical protein [Chlorogloeopsis fritschii C42_A2020_084]